MVSSANIARIYTSATSLTDPIHVQGAPLSAQALITVRYLQDLQTEGHANRPTVILCPDQETAQDLIADLDTFSKLIPQNPLRVLSFPTWEQSPYLSISPSIRIRLTRLQVLESFFQKSLQAPQVIVTTLAASCQATLPRTLFEKYSIRLSLNDSIHSRETLISKLIESGYARIETVEDPGTFAVRGEIVDVFASNLARPIRIELFGDLVERIRYFDPTTQRTSNQEEQTLSSVFFSPAREVLINQQTSALLRERIKGRADDLGISRLVRDPVLASIQNSNYPDHCDAWAPFAYEEIETLWDYLVTKDQLPTQVLWIDELSCLQGWEAFQTEQIRLCKESSGASLILPPFSDLFRWTSSLERSIRASTRIFFDRVQLANLETLEKAETDEPSGPEDASPFSTHHRVSVNLNTDLQQGVKHSLENLEPKIKLWLKQNYQIVIIASTESQIERIRFLLNERGFSCLVQTPPAPSQITAWIGTLSEGFRWPAEKIAFLTEQELIGTKGKKLHLSSKRDSTEPASGAKNWSDLQSLSDLSVGDAVVHIDHGIGRYQGLVRLDLTGAPSDFLLLEYANKDKLYLPVYRLNIIQKYIGASDGISLDRLGSQQFSKTKDKVKTAVRKLAIDLIQLYAQRKLRPGIQFAPPDSLFREFEAEFPFDETPDQLKSIRDILHDLESGRSMDRLVCGDVGYGKTEVAMRAAFRAVSEGKQVAVLVPTTVLAFQHEQSFKNRLKNYPINIESISRFKSPKEQKRILEDLASGKIDIIIGTHRLLSGQIKFSDLGLIIIDEEHRFGVEHKERLKTLKVNTHVLTLTATPIPRTLHMALSGLRDISLINTAPVDRLPIRTYVSKYDEALIQRAIQFEVNRGGQVFFLHNRVQSIYEVAKKIQELIPSITVSVAHGQMSEQELEEAMISFYEKRSQLLVCTTIIESGLDVPSANTMIINRADTLGLAQLYQIRGRVGRSQLRAYAYLLIPAEGAVTDDAKRRLEVIQKFVELGSGFSIASHDLEIRGGGDLLGAQQSGNVNAVGFDLYMEILEEAIRELQGKPIPTEEQAREPEIKTPFSAYLSEEFVPDIHQRLSLYRRLSAASNEQALSALEEEIRDRFGALPLEAYNLIWLIRIKQLLKNSGIDSLTVGPQKVSLLPSAVSKLNPSRAIALVSSKPDRYQLLPDSKFVAKLETESLQSLFFGLEKLISLLF